MIGYVHSLESFGAADGPGVRFVVFMQGCRLRCRFCHNPDSWPIHEPTEQTFEASALLDRAERFRPYWGKEGGITVSGGEPLLQIDFLLELFSEAKRRGIHTCLDTAAQPFAPSDEAWMAKFEALMKVTDLVLLDIKHIDSERHLWETGQGNENILACARYLSDIAQPVWIRHVLVPTVSDQPEYLQRLADFIHTLKNVERVEVLPYHTLGIFKWEQLGIPYTLKDVPTPTDEQILAAEQILCH